MPESRVGKFGERRLLYRMNGRWWYAGWDNHGRGPVGWRLWLHVFRVCDRLFVGRDNGRNHW